MLEVILDKRLVFILVGFFAALGIISKCVVSISLKKLTKAAGNMGKSSHGLIRLVRAKYEHACMVSDRVQNVDVFVEKFMYEYKILGIRLQGWRTLERAAAWLCLAAGILGAGAEYSVRGMDDQVLRYAALGAGVGILLFLLRLTMDETYQLSVIRAYMVDYLDNVCARKYEKSRESHEVREPVEKPAPREEVPEPKEEPQVVPPVTPKPYRVPESGQEVESVQPEVIHMEKEEEKEVSEEKKLGAISKEVLIREILEEFLA